MKLIHILQIMVLLACSSGIVGAANDTANVDISKMVDMEDVKTSAMSFWSEAKDTGNLVLGMVLVFAVGSVIFVILYGIGVLSFGSASKKAETANSGESAIIGAVKAALYGVIGLLIVAVVWAQI